MSGPHASPPGRDETVTGDLLLFFAPIHKRALGMAVGLTAALLVFGLTVLHLTIIDPANAPRLSLLGEYFLGYRVSWTGAFIGAFWAFFGGFVAGWFLAFCRNLVIAASIFLTRTRAELLASRDFLDHI